MVGPVLVPLLHPQRGLGSETAVQMLAAQFHGWELSQITPPAILMARGVVWDRLPMERLQKVPFRSSLSTVFSGPGVALGCSTNVPVWTGITWEVWGHPRTAVSGLSDQELWVAYVFFRRIRRAPNPTFPASTMEPFKLLFSAPLHFLWVFFLCYGPGLKQAKATSIILYSLESLDILSYMRSSLS